MQKRNSRQARPWQQTDYNELIVLFFDFIGKSHYLCTAFHRKAKKVARMVESVDTKDLKSFGI